MTITIKDVIEQCARVCAEAEAELWRTHKKSNRSGQYIEGAADQAEELATAIRALSAQYEGCIVAQGEAQAWASPGKERLEFSRKDTVYGSHTIPLYRAREKS